MKILHLVVSRHFAGSERIACSLAFEQHKAGHEVMVSYRPHGEFQRLVATSQYAGVNFFRVSRYFFKRSIAKVFRDFKPDVVHYHLTTAVKKIPIITELIPTRHVSHLHIHKSSSVYRIAADVGRLIAISKATLDYYVSEVGVNSERIDLVYNGIDLNPADVMTISKLDAKRFFLSEFDLSLDAPLVVLPGRLHEDKGHIDLIRALPTVVEKFPKLRCVFAGGNNAKSNYRELLLKEVSNLGLEKQVFFPGWRSDIVMLMRAADVQIVPSRVEPFGLAVIEAMALETPVVTTGIDGIKDIAKPGLNCLVYNVGDHVLLAENLLCLLLDKGKNSEIVKYALKDVEERFSVKKFAEEVEAVYLNTEKFECR